MQPVVRCYNATQSFKRFKFPNLARNLRLNCGYDPRSTCSGGVDMFRMIKAALLGAVSLLVTAPASHATAILVGQCIEFAACFSSGPTPWSDNLTTANLTALGLGTTQPLVAAQTSMTTIRLGVTTIDFATTTGPVVEMLPEFSGGIHSDPCNFCEIDIVGDFLIPANATSATISGSTSRSCRNKERIA